MANIREQIEILQADLSGVTHLRMAQLRVYTLTSRQNSVLGHNVK